MRPGVRDVGVNTELMREAVVWKPNENMEDLPAGFSQEAKGWGLSRKAKEPPKPAADSRLEQISLQLLFNLERKND